MTQQIKTFHTHQEVFMWNESGRGVHKHHSIFKLIVLTVGFKSHLNGITKSTEFITFLS
jgi:hypothetical protein